MSIVYNIEKIFERNLKKNKTYFGSNPSLGALGLFFNLTHSASLVLLLGWPQLGLPENR